MKKEWLAFVSAEVVDMSCLLFSTARQYCFNQMKFYEIPFSQFFTIPQSNPKASEFCSGARAVML